MTDILLVSRYPQQLIMPPLKAKLRKAGNYTIFEALPKLNQAKLDSPAMILAIDPDSCNWWLPDDLITGVPNLKAICLSSTSFDWLNIKLATQKNIPVVNTRDWCTQSTAEWALYMAKTIARSVPMTSQKMKTSELMVIPRIEINGKTAGIIGLGKIGTKIAELCQNQGMKIIYWSKNSLDPRFFRVNLSHLFKHADFIFPAFEVNPQTSKIITKKRLSQMKPSSSMIALWPQKKLFDHQYILSQTKNRKIFGFAFEDNDFKGEKYPGNVFATQPIGWATQDSAVRNAQKWVDNIVNATQGKFPNRVN